MIIRHRISWQKIAEIFQIILKHCYGTALHYMAFGISAWHEAYYHTLFMFCCCYGNIIFEKVVIHFTSESTWITQVSSILEKNSKFMATYLIHFIVLVAEQMMYCCTVEGIDWDYEASMELNSMALSVVVVMVFDLEAFVVEYKLWWMG